MNTHAESTNKRSRFFSVIWAMIDRIVLVAIVAAVFLFLGKKDNDEITVLRDNVLALQTDIESSNENFSAVVPDVHQLKDDVASLKAEYMTALEQVNTLSQKLESGGSLDIIREEIGYNKADFDGLFAQFKTLAAKIESIEKTLAVSSVAKAQTQVKTETVAPRATPPSPPFEVIGVESRGSEYFLAVAPKTARSVAEIKLFREHDTIVGAWVLKNLVMDKAVFSVHGRDVTIAVN